MNLIDCLLYPLWRLVVILSPFRGRNGPAENLAGQLRKARIEDTVKKSHFYIPRTTTHELINESTIIEILAQHIDCQRVLQRTVRETYQRGKALFAILVLVGKEAEIELFFRGNIFDDQLPLRRRFQDNEFNLWTEDGGLVTATGHWESRHRENFYSFQWWFLAPVFKDLKHYELHEDASLPTLPLLPRERHLVTQSGGFSDVLFVRFHPAQMEWSQVIDPECQGPLCAVKCLLQSDRDEFKREQQILLRLTPKEYPHLIKLLSTYRKDGKWHLIFPFADSNLREYWDRRPVPEFDRDTVLWSLTQMTGIAGALDMIHNLTVTINVTDHGHVDSSNGTTQHETLYGRHGDIKPENFLWFQRARNVGDPGGVLQLADFGLGRLHGRYSPRGQTLANDVPCSPTYEPPECRIGGYVTQAYDMWSLGCVLLEFVTWLVLKSDEVYRFADYRGEYSPRTGINDDKFYTITSDTTAIVRASVLDWVEMLRYESRSSQLILDLLHLITEHLIVVDPSDRIESNELHQELGRMLNRATDDNSYSGVRTP